MEVLKTNLKGSYRRRIFWVYLFLTLIPILIFVTYVHTQYINVLKDHTADTLVESTEALVLNIEAMFEQMSRIATALSLDKEIDEVYLPQKPNEVNALKQKLNMHIQTSLYVESITLYWQKGEYLFSNTSSYTKERYMEINGFSNMTLPEFEALMSERYSTRVLSSDKPYPTMYILKPLLTAQDNHKHLIFKVPCSWLQPYMKKALLSNEGYCHIADASGKIIASYTTQGLAVPEEVLMQANESGGNLSVGNAVWHTVLKDCGTEGMTCYVAVRNGSIRANMMHLIRNWLVLLGIVLLLSFAAAYLASQYSFYPISKLEKKVSLVSAVDEMWNDEVEHISVSIDHLNRMALSLGEHLEELNDYLTFRLLRGSIENVDEANQLSSILGTSVYAAAYQIAIVSFGKTLSNKDAQKSIRAILDQSMSCLLRPSGSNWACALFYSVHDQGLLDSFSERFMAEYPDGHLAFGDVRKSLAEVPISYMQALCAIEEEQGSVVSYVNQPHIQKAAATLSQSLSQGQYDESLRIVEQLYGEMELNTLPKAKYIALLISTSISNWHDSIAKTLDIPDVYMLIACSDKVQLLAYLQPITDALNAKIQQNYQEPVEEPLIDQMKAYIRSKFREPTFSLQQMAFDFRMAPATLSRYFKQNSDTGINDFLNELKMETAKQLLLESNLPVYEIGLELGYYGPNSFIRRFKATFGITPGEFRNMHTSSNTEKTVSEK